MKYVLLSDLSLLYDYRGFPLLDFLPVAPSNAIPQAIYSFLRGAFSPALPNGELKYAPYAIRKLEAALLAGGREVAVVHPDYLSRFIDDGTELIGVSTMDPLGLGPLTMSYAALFRSRAYPWVRKEWEGLIRQINAARAGKKAKLMVGGPGVWEFTIMPEELARLGIDFAYQGEADDIACELFDQVAEDRLDRNAFFTGFMSFDESFKRFYSTEPRFITRRPGAKNYPSLDEIPMIVRPSMKSMTEIMRGCGIGCDFCEVTLRPLRYYSVENIVKEIEVNIRGGFNNAWLHTDEFFAYRHGPLFRPNEEALLELITAVMSVKGVGRTNPTHGRVSIPAAYPDLIRKLSSIMKAGPDNWIGMQVGIETGSDRLAKIHMPSKTLPLRIGPDGTWADIVWEGTMRMTHNYWRAAYTLQTGQDEETPEDNWETVALINRMSNSSVDGRPFEFTVTPMQHVPLGVLRNEEFPENLLDESQMAVYYASYRHLSKMASRDAVKDSSGSYLSRMGMSALIGFGGWVMMKYVESMAKKRGVDLEKAKRYGLDGSAGKLEVTA